jgi:heme-degrading monooxygenase HmoA
MPLAVRLGAGTVSVDAEDLIAPPDQRFTREFDDISTSTKPRVDASANLYVITNLDIAASNLTQAELALHNLAAAVRQINGNRGVEILRQANHANHFNLISAWTAEAPFHAGLDAADVRCASLSKHLGTSGAMKKRTHN